MTTPPNPAKPNPERPRRGRAKAVAGLLAGVLLAHMALLGALPSRPGRDAVAAPLSAPLALLPALAPATSAPRPVTLLAPPARVEPAATPVAVQVPAAGLAAPTPLRARTPVTLAMAVLEPGPTLVLPAPRDNAPAASGREAEPEIVAAVAPAAKVVATEPPALPPRAAASAPSTSPPTPLAPEGGVDVPVYATRLPPAVTLDYELRRGILSGTGELRWRPAGAGYELDLAGSVLGIDVIGWSSRGGFDNAGLAPLRYVDRRRGKAAVAANFQREAGIVSFSGPTTTYALVPGTQDRLSWMLQLPAIVEANPARFHAGARIELYVVGAHGEADLWAFVVRGFEAVEVPAGRVEAALLLQREPQRAYDTRVDIWLDPARHHLPARARLTTMPSGDALELSLRQYRTE